MLCIEQRCQHPWQDLQHNRFRKIETKKLLKYLPRGSKKPRGWIAPTSLDASKAIFKDEEEAMRLAGANAEAEARRERTMAPKTSFCCCFALF